MSLFFCTDSAEMAAHLRAEKHDGRVLIRAERDGHQIRVETGTPEELAAIREAHERNERKDREP